MKNIKTLILALLVSGLNAQQVEEPNYGLALSATGMSVFTLGVTMKPSLIVQQYNPKFGYNYIKYDSVDRQKIKITTLAFGAIFTITGIIIQNIRRNKKSQQVIKI